MACCSTKGKCIIYQKSKTLVRKNPCFCFCCHLAPPWPSLCSPPAAAPPCLLTWEGLCKTDADASHILAPRRGKSHHLENHLSSLQSPCCLQMGFAGGDADSRKPRSITLSAAGCLRSWLATDGVLFASRAVSSSALISHVLGGWFFSRGFWFGFFFAGFSLLSVPCCSITFTDQLP